MCLFLRLNFSVSVLTDKTAVKISLRSFTDSYYYDDARLPELKSYLEGKTSQQGLLAVKVSRKSDTNVVVQNS